MDTILLEGATYTKASILAKRFRYTPDYIGQLCRSGKVVCHMVGRTWYVTESSLLEHRDGRYKEIRLDEKTSNLNTISSHDDSVLVKSRRLPANPLAPVSDRSPHFVDRLAWVQPRYVADEAELLPQPAIKKKKILPQVPSAPAKLSVDHAQAVVVEVESESPHARKLEFTDLPEVPLRGDVTVEAVDVPADIFPLPPTPKSKPSPVVNPTMLASTAEMSKGHRVSKSVSTPVRSSVRFTPSVIVVESDAPESTKALFALSAMVAIIFVLFLATTSYSYTFESGNLSAAVQLSWENLRDFFAQISTDL